MNHHDEVCGCGDDHELSNRGSSRREVLDMLAAGGLWAAFSAISAGYPSAASAAEDGVVRIGYLPITDASALLVAYAKGFFKDEGLEAEKPTLIRGWSPLVESFAAAKFNIVHLLKPIPVWMRYNNKFPAKIMAWGHTNGSGLVVGQHVAATAFAELGGKQIAVPFWYSMHNIVLQIALREAGLVPVIKGEGEAIAPNEVNLQICSRQTCRQRSPRRRSMVTSSPSHLMRLENSRLGRACSASRAIFGKTTLVA